MGSEAERNITSVFWAEIYGVFSMHFDTQRSWRQSVFFAEKERCCQCPQSWCNVCFDLMHVRQLCYLYIYMIYYLKCTHVLHLPIPMFVTTECLGGLLGHKGHQGQRLHRMWSAANGSIRSSVVEI